MGKSHITLKRAFLFSLFFFFISSLFAQLGNEPVQVDIQSKEVKEEFALYVEIRLEISKNVYVYTEKSHFFQIEETASTGLDKNTKITMPPTITHKNFDGSTIQVLEGRQKILLVKSYSGKTGDPWEFTGFFQYQACDKSVCYAPEKVDFHFQGIIPQGKPADTVKPADTSKPADTTKPADTNAVKQDQPQDKDREWQTLAQDFTIKGSCVGYKTKNEFLAFLDNVESGKADESDWTGNLAEKSLWLVLAIVFFGGLALNLTPCVLPLIPVNIAILGAGAKGGSRSKGFFLGTVYGLGMSLAYGILGLVVVFTGSKFGALNASPWFNFGIALLFAVLALAMFDMISIDFSRWRSKRKIAESQKGKFLTAFGMGIVSALLAGACVAPVVISVLLYSSTLYADGKTAGLFLPFLLGIGMAFPWPFAGASLSFLPKPGAWMVKIKYFFGIFIILMAAYYGNLGLQILEQEKALDQASQKPVISHEGWTDSLVEGMLQAKKENKPAFIDFWASWCKNCLAMEETTFKDADVQKRLTSYVKIKYRAEKPNIAPARPVLDYFKSMGLPTYVIIQPNSKK